MSDHSKPRAEIKLGTVLTENGHFDYQQFAQFMGQLNYGLVAADSEGLIVFWGGGAESMWGYTRDEAVGMPISMLYAPEEAPMPALDIILEQLKINGEMQKERMLRRKSGGDFYGQESTSVVYDMADSLHKRILIFSDVTERKETERRLQHAIKFEAVGRLASGIAHDFNNLLTIIKGHAGLLLAASDCDPDCSGSMQLIMAAAERGAELTYRLLDCTSPQPLRQRRTDLNERMLELIALCERIIKENICLETRLAPGLWPVRIDPGELENALLNIIVNGCDAMPTGGKICLETYNIRLDDEFSASQINVCPGEYAVIAVSDTGSGIDKDLLGEVFQAFFTTKDNGQGSGLGLSMVQGFVEQSGGHITIFSEVDKGTTVRIYLPRLIAEGSPD